MANESLNLPQQITDIARITESGGIYFDSTQDIPDYVELPLIPTCINLFNKNIRTTWSSANSEQKVAEIYIDYPSLSEENKKIILSIKSDLDLNYSDIPLSIPISSQTTPEEIHEYFFNISELFKFQNATWEPTYTIEQMQKWGAGNTIEKIIETTNNYYSPDDKLFFRNKDAYIRFHGLNKPETI